MTALAGNWNYPTSIRFGAGRIAELADACRAAGIARPLLVTDRGLATKPMVTDAAAAGARPRDLQRHRQRSYGR
jgi:alcohol dehydrogenase class IV